jgi:hypothetical protein
MMDGRLQLLYPLPGELLTLQWYWSRDVPAPITDIELASGQSSFICDLQVPVSPHPPRTLNCRLFSLAVHEEVLTELCLGSAFAPTLELAHPQGVVFQFVNTNNVRQGTLTLTWRNPDLEALSRIPEDFHDPTNQQYTQSLIDRVKGCYQQRAWIFNSRQIFHTISTDNGFLPTIAFPLLATLSLPIQERHGRFYVRNLVIACRLVGVEMSALESLSAGVLLEVINEMLTMVTKALVYTPDRTRSASNAILFNEDWQRLSIFPHRPLAGYDCEDCAQQIQELAHPFRRRDTALPTVFAPVCEILSRMTFFTVEGDLQTPEGWTPHCYTVAVDSLYVDYLITPGKKRLSSFMPSVVLEGTSWAQGVFALPPQGGKGSTSSFRGVELLGGKVYTPYTGLRSSPYGPVAQMQSADHRGEMLTLAMVRDGVMGVQLEEIVFHEAEPSDVRVLIRSEPRRIEAELLELPLPSIPSWPPIAGNMPTNKQVGQRAVMRAMDYSPEVCPSAAVEIIPLTEDGMAIALLTIR